MSVVRFVMLPVLRGLRHCMLTGQRMLNGLPDPVDPFSAVLIVSVALTLAAFITTVGVVMLGLVWVVEAWTP